MDRQKATCIVRISPDTRERLRAMIADICAAIDRGHADDVRDQVGNPNPDALEMSYDRAIAILLDQRAAWKARVRKARRKPA